MKSEYYLATVVSAYRKAIDFFAAGGTVLPEEIATAPEKTAHREFTTAYSLGANDNTVNYTDSSSRGTATFIAQVLSGGATPTVEMRNRFQTGEVLEVLSANPAADGKTFVVPVMTDEEGGEVTDAKRVQQKLTLTLPFAVEEGDILRRADKNA